MPKKSDGERWWFHLCRLCDNTFSSRSEIEFCRVCSIQTLSTEVPL